MQTWTSLSKQRDNAYVHIAILINLKVPFFDGILRLAGVWSETRVLQSVNNPKIFFLGSNLKP